MGLLKIKMYRWSSYLPDEKFVLLKFPTSDKKNIVLLILGWVAAAGTEPLAALILCS